jgi:hypothetical protein
MIGEGSRAFEKFFKVEGQAGSDLQASKGLSGLIGLDNGALDPTWSVPAQANIPMSAELKKTKQSKTLDGLLGALGSILAAILVGLADLAKSFRRSLKR